MVSLHALWSFFFLSTQGSRVVDVLESIQYSIWEFVYFTYFYPAQQLDPSFLRHNYAQTLQYGSQKFQHQNTSPIFHLSIGHRREEEETKRRDRSFFSISG
ncbi:hypothetical protein [Phaffia rhodozyma]|uniref:Secreted protein n=1 Tax=Phaffia rhodozyma TaxID=264483 RepID=A0A0F7SNY8_PHARH|nr:hypothetical protein [Phaffia rhodozyma]